MKKKLEKIIISSVVAISSLCAFVPTFNVSAEEMLTMERQQAFFAPTSSSKDYTLQEVSEDLYAIQGEKVNYLIVKGNDGVLVGADLDTADYAKLKASIETKISIENLSVALTDSRAGLSDQLKSDGATVYVAKPDKTITLDNDTTDTTDDIVLTSISMPGHTECSTIWMDEGNNTIFSGDALGDGTIYLRDTGFCLGTYETQSTLRTLRDFHTSATALLNKTDENTVIYSNNKIINNAEDYVKDILTVVYDIITFNYDRIHTFINEGVNGDMTSNFITTQGTAKVVWHMPIFGLTGYDLYGFHFKGETFDFLTTKYELDNGYDVYNLTDSDIQSCYIIMNNEEALLIDTSMYGDITKAVKSLIGDRKLSIYVTHPHGDHYGGMSQFLPAGSPSKKDIIENYNPNSARQWWEFEYESDIPVSQIKAIYFPKLTDDQLKGLTLPKEMSTSKASVYDMLQEFSELGVEINYTDDGSKFSVSGRNFELIRMVGHSTGDMILVDTSARVMFSGDILGTESFLGGYGINSDTYPNIYKSLEYLWSISDKFDFYFEGHQNYRIPTEHIKNNMTLVKAYLDYGKAATYNGRTLAMVNGKMITSVEEFNALEQIDFYQYGSLNANLNRYKRTDSTIEAADVTTNVNATAKIEYTTNNNEGKLTFVSSDETIAKVDENGVVKGIKEGTCIITVSAPLTANYDVGSTEIKVVVNKEIKIEDDMTTTPEKPNETITPEEPTVTPKDPIKTGDYTNMATWGTAATLALGGLVLVIKKSKKEEA